MQCSKEGEEKEKVEVIVQNIKDTYVLETKRIKPYSNKTLMELIKGLNTTASKKTQDKKIERAIRKNKQLVVEINIRDVAYKSWYMHDQEEQKGAYLFFQVRTTKSLKDLREKLRNYCVKYETRNTRKVGNPCCKDWIYV